MPELNCVYCNRETTSKVNLKKHMQKHVKEVTGYEPFQCEYCGKTFITKNRVLSHISYVHTKIRPIKCDICGLSFPTKAHLTRHMISHVIIALKIDLHEEIWKNTGFFLFQTKEKPHICSICGRKFAHKGNMMAHKRQHDGETEKTHNCSFCQATFPRKYKLLEHLAKNHETALPHTTSKNDMIFDTTK